MNQYRININYARALFLLATERDETAQVADDMRLVNKVSCENRQLATLFANPTIRQDKKVSIIKELFSNQIGPSTMAFLLFVVKKNRSVHLKGISEAYLDLFRESQDIVLSELVTHQEVDDAAREAVIRLIGDYTGKKVELRTITDPRMLGGFKMEFDHNMYDARLRTKILKLRQEFAKNDYEKKL